MLSTLFRRRLVWLPTVWGWLFLLVLAAGAVLGLTLDANRWLALSEPAAGARTLVVEGWLDEGALDQALVAFRRGHYERVLVTGGPIESRYALRPWTNFAEMAAAYLRARGLHEVPVIAVAAPASAQERSFLSAVMVREWARQSGVRLDAIDLFSAGVHARRSRMLYRLALGAGVEVGVLASVPQDHDAQRWWTSSSGVKAVIGETLSLLWTQCCFWPPPHNSHEERWAVPRSAP